MTDTESIFLGIIRFRKDLDDISRSSFWGSMSVCSNGLTFKGKDQLVVEKAEIKQIRIEGGLFGKSFIIYLNSRQFPSVVTFYSVNYAQMQQAFSKFDFAVK